MNRVICCIIAAVSIFSARSLAQIEGDKVTSMNLGFDTHMPGHEVLIPLVLDVPDGVEVGTAVSEVTFPNQLLAFNEVARGLSAQAVNAEVGAVVHIDEKNHQDSVVMVTVSATEGQSIPSGVIADLAFTISEDASLEQTVKLKNVVKAMTAQKELIDPIVGMGGEIRITASPPIFACFFYMH